jgi:isopentenyl-diphosphate delta-isomerase type 1
MLSIENTKDELIIIVDEKDNFIKTASRREMRANNLTHRATSIFVLNKEKEFLIQKRSEKKEFCPGYYDLNFGGVVGAGEDDIKQVYYYNKQSAIRELGEELGIAIDNDDKLLSIGKTYYHDSIVSIWSYVYMIEIDKETNVTFFDGEVSSVKWVTKDEIISMIESGENITPDGKECFLHFIKSNEFMNLLKQ